MKNDKKNYVSPEISVVEINATSIICGSGVSGESGETGGTIGGGGGVTEY